VRYDSLIADRSLTETHTTPFVSIVIPEGYEYHVAAHPEHDGLTCRFLRHQDFSIADVPSESLNFDEGVQFMPLAVAIAPYGPMVFSIAARPAFDDGAVAQWLEYICEQEGYPHTTVVEWPIGELPAVMCDAIQVADGVTMKMRFVLLEDGGRIFQMSAMAPEPFWENALGKMAPMLSSFELQEVRGSHVPLLAGGPSPSTRATTDGKHEASALERDAMSSDTSASDDRATLPAPTPLLTSAEISTIALANDATSLDPEQPTNARLRDNGIGLVPRIVSVDLHEKSARVGAGAIQGMFRVPLGWHVIDDGQRTLVFDGDGCIQVSVNQRQHEGATPEAFARACLEQAIEQQPDLPTIAATLGDIAAAGVRGISVDAETLDQYYFVRDVGRDGMYLVARVSATAEHITRALDLAGDVLATFTAPRAES